MSEPLFVFLLLASLACIVPCLLRMARGDRCGLARLAAGGMLLGLTILTRPAALYLPLVLIGCLLALGWRHRSIFRSIMACLILLFSIAPLPALWIARNAVVFSIPHLSTVDAANKVYFVGGGAYQIHFQISLEEAQALIAREYNLPTYNVSQNPWICQRSLSEIDSELRQAALPVMTKYPFDLVEACLLGVVKATFSHNTSRFADLLGGVWIAPRTGELLQFRIGAWERLQENGTLFLTVFGWQMLHVLLSLLLALLGIIGSLRLAATREAAWILLFVLAYFYLTVAVFGMEAYCRCRVPVLPFLYAFAGAGLHRIWQVATRLLNRRSLQLPQRRAVV